MLLSIAFIILTNYLLGNFNIAKVTNFDFKQNLFEIINRSQFATRGEASFPEWTKYNSNIEILYKTPLKMFLFYVSLPGSQKIKSLISMLDGFFYFF